MPLVKPSHLVRRQTLLGFKHGDGKYLSKNFKLKRMWMGRRLLCRIAPRLFLPRSSHDTVMQLKKKLADYRIGNTRIGESNAEEILTRAGVARKEGDSLSAISLLDREHLDMICETTDQLLGKRKRRDNLTDIENRPPTAKRKALTEMNSMQPPVSQKPTERTKPLNWTPLTPEQMNPARDSQPKVSQEPTAVYRQVASPSKQTENYETTLFGQVKGRYCEDQERYQFLRSFYFSLQDFEPDLDDRDFVKLVKIGKFYDIESDLMYSWDQEEYKKEAIRMMQGAGKTPGKQ